MSLGIFLEIKDDNILPVGLELIGKALSMMKDSSYKIHGIVVINKEVDNNFLDNNLGKVRKYLDKLFIYEYEAEYLTTEHYKEALCDYIENMKAKILLIGATHLGRSFGPRLAAHFKTGITADCTEIRYEEEYGLVQIRPAFGEEVLAEIVTPETFPQIATVRPGIMDPPQEIGKEDGEVRIYKKNLSEKKLTIIDRYEVKEETRLDKAQIVVIAGNAIKEKEDLLLVRKLAKVLGGEFGTTRPLVEGGLVPYSRQVGVSGTILSAKIVLLLGVSGSNQTMTGIRKAEKIIAINNDPEASIFQKVDIGIVDDWKDVVMCILNKKGG